MKILSFETFINKTDLLTPFLRSRLAIVDETNDSEEVLDLIKFYEYDAILLRLSDRGAGPTTVRNTNRQTIALFHSLARSGSWKPEHRRVRRSLSAFRLARHHTFQG